MKNTQLMIVLMLTATHYLICANTLFEKAKEGNIKSVKHLVMEKNQKIDSLVKGESPLLVAVKNYKEPGSIGVKNTKKGQEKESVDYDQVIIFLLAHGASMAIEDNQGRTVFHYAVGLQNAHLLKLLLENINRPSERAFNIADNNGRTPLHLACELANFELVKILCDAGARVDLKTRIDAKTPMEVIGQSKKDASAITKTSIREYLLKSQRMGIKPQAIKRHSSISLQKELKNNDSNQAKKTLSGYCKSQPSESAESPLYAQLGIQLMNAVADGDLQKVKQLIKEGAPVSFKDEEETTPLMSAVIFFEPFKQYKEIVEYLIAHHASLLDKDKKGRTALHYAVQEEKDLLIKAMLDATRSKSDFDKIIGAQDNQGNTPLHLAAMVANVPITKLLLKDNASINARNKERKIPLEVINTQVSLNTRSKVGLASDIIEMKNLLSKHGATIKASTAATVISKQIPITSKKPAPVVVEPAESEEDISYWNNLSKEGRTRSHSTVRPILTNPAIKRD